MKKNKQPRHDHDNYPTPLALARVGWQLAKKYSLEHKTVLEPGCGDLQPFLIATGGEVPTLIGCDVRDVEAQTSDITVVTSNFLEERRLLDHGGFDVIMANPPFTQAAEFAEHALELVSPWGCVVFLCRQSFHYPGQVRKAFWKKHPPIHVSTITPRPSFRADGKTDGCEYAYYVWAPWMALARKRDCGIEVQTTLGWVEWSKPPRKRLQKENK